MGNCNVDEEGGRELSKRGKVYVHRLRQSQPYMLGTIWSTIRWETDLRLYRAGGWDGWDDAAVRDGGGVDGFGDGVVNWWGGDCLWDIADASEDYDGE